jgi:hypothetical protein
MQRYLLFLKRGRKQGPWPLTSYSPGIDPKALVFALPAGYLSTIKEAIEELQRKTSILQTYADNSRNEGQKRCSNTAFRMQGGVLPNFLEMDRSSRVVHQMAHRPLALLNVR